MLMEVMGLHLPGAAFVNPGTPLRDALTAAAAQRAVEITAEGAEYTPVGQVVDERAIVNAIVGLLATGGSTNHTIHLVAIARSRRHPHQLGRLPRPVRGGDRCSPASIPTARPTSTSSTPPAAWAT